MEVRKIFPKDKKGVLGLETVKGVMVWFLVLAVLAVTIILALSSMRDVAESIDTTSENVTDTELAVTNASAGAVNLTRISGSQYRNSVCTITLVLNATSDDVILASNYTTSNSGCSVTGVNDSLFINSSSWNITYTAVYANPETNLIVVNITNALADDFFNQTGTIFAILIVVVIILAISIIIAVVMRFGGGGGGEVSMGGSGGKFGSDTVVGV